MIHVSEADIARLGLHLQRVLVIDPSQGAAELCRLILRGMGARRVELHEDSRKAFSLAERLNPQLVVTEYAGEGVNGVKFTHRLRRSSLPCRTAPVIVVTALATAGRIKDARDAGAHEFLRKPYSATELFRRVENVSLKERTWVEAQGYVGPCRRRFNDGGYHGPRRREADPEIEGQGGYLERVDMACRILRSAITRFDDDPTQAVRAIRAQAEALNDTAASAADPRMSQVVTALSRLVEGAARRGERPTMPPLAFFTEVTAVAAELDARAAAA